MKIHALFASILACYVPHVFANQIETPLQVLNQNFESDLINSESHYNSHIIGWLNTGLGETGVSAPLEDNEYTTAPEHGQVAFLKGKGQLSQTLQVPLENHISYKLSFDVGLPVSSNSETLVVKFKSQGLILSYTQIDTSSITKGTWQSGTVQFTPTVDMPLHKPLTIEFLNHASALENELHIDNIALAQVGESVPSRMQKTGIGMIAENIVLRVPQDHDKIVDALAYLQPHVIKADKTATIFVSDCSNQTLSDTLTIQHPQGENIHIIGNTKHPERCQLNISGKTGIHLTEGSQLGLLDGFSINSEYTSDGANTGILVSKNANLNMGKNMVLKGFSSALRAEKKGAIFANGVTYIQNDIDAEAVLGGVIQSEGSKSLDNKNFGFFAHKSGYIFAKGSNVTNKEGTAYYSESKSYIDADQTISQSKNDNYQANRSSAISVQEASVLMPEQRSARASALSYIDTSNSNIVDASPQIGGTGSQNSSVK